MICAKVARLLPDPQSLRQDKLALVGELLADASHECNNQLAFVLSNLQNLAEYGDELARVVGAYRDRVREAGLGDAQLVRLEADVDLDFLLEDAGRAARDGLHGATRLRDMLKLLARLGEDEPADSPLIDLGKVVRQVLTVEAKSLSLRAELTTELETEATVCAPPSLVARAIVVMVKDAILSFDDGRRDGKRLLVRMERRGPQVAVVVAPTGGRGSGSGRDLRLAELAAEAMGGALAIEPERTTLILPVAS
jgi:signal transduction histidine kinase